MNKIKLIILVASTIILRKLFIRETKKLSKKLGIPLWKVQALVIAGIIICVGGVWYVYTKGFNDGSKDGIKEGVKTGFDEGFKEGVNKGKWRAVNEIAKLDPNNEFIEYLDGLGVVVKDKYDYYETIYDKAPWGFRGEWD